MKIDTKLDENGHHFDSLFLICYSSCWEDQTLIEWLNINNISHFNIIFHLILHKFIDVSWFDSFTHHFAYCLRYNSPCASNSLARTSFNYRSRLCCFISHFLIFFLLLLLLLWWLILRNSNRCINWFWLDNFFFCWLCLLLLWFNLLFFLLLSFRRHILILRNNDLRFLLIYLLVLLLLLFRRL